MTNSEFSAQFDVLWNNVTSNQAPGVNEYEKSVFLTKAQSQLVNEYFNNRTDGFGGGFDGSQKRQYDFSGLVRVEQLYDVNTFVNRIDETEKLDKRSKVYLFPQNYFLAVNEIISDGRWQYSVIPLSYAEYQRVMTKPYNFPIKRGAWRIFTDKKNCNYWEQYVTTTEGTEEVITPITYSFLSSWADKKRNLKVHVVTDATWDSTVNDEIEASETKCFVRKDSGIDAFYFKGTSKEGNLEKFDYYGEIMADCYWSDSSSATEEEHTEDPITYIINLTVKTSQESNEDLDDETVFAILKDGFGIFNKYYNISESDSDVSKAAKRTDGFLNSNAPSKFKKCVNDEMSFITKVVPIPMAEIIGKFHGNLKYQLRYIRTLTPIILEDLTNYGDDITIDGVTAATECALPVETHQEILERAVTLAKIAWQGGTMTQAAAKDNS